MREITRKTFPNRASCPRSLYDDLLCWGSWLYTDFAPGHAKMSVMTAQQNVKQEASLDPQLREIGTVGLPPAQGEHVATQSCDMAETRLSDLQCIFPEVFVEGKLDIAKLRTILGTTAEAGPSRYHFGWAGKNDAVALLQTPSRGTLLPVPEESLNFDGTENVFIEGDNLEVLKLLFKPYFGRVKLIYIDPPYNTGQDFIYPDNYADPLKTYLQLTGQVDSEGNLLTSNPETGGRYHSSWLSMMYPRLFLARQLLREDGLVCISIDDHEMHHLRLLLNEIFGEENFVATCIWQKRYSRENRGIIGDVHDYLIFFAREKETLAQFRGLLRMDEESEAVYKNPNNDPKGRWRGIPMTAQGRRPNQMYKIVTPSGAEHSPPPPLLEHG